MKIDQENSIQARNYPWRVALVIDRDLDLLRARAWERSAWVVRMQRVQETAVTVMAIILGGFVGWVMMR